MALGYAWVSERVIQARVPAEIRPLVFERKLVGLRKPSHHQQSIDTGAAAAAASYMYNLQV